MQVTHGYPGIGKCGSGIPLGLLGGREEAISSEPVWVRVFVGKGTGVGAEREGEQAESRSHLDTVTKCERTTPGPGARWRPGQQPVPLQTRGMRGHQVFRSMHSLSFSDDKARPPECCVLLEIEHWRPVVASWALVVMRVLITWLR